jgi:uncharacterized repeat protein (TIGR01451 family)
MKRTDVASSRSKPQPRVSLFHIGLLLIAVFCQWPRFEARAAEPPVILGFTPQSGPAGAQVMIEGQHLEEAAAVFFNDVPAEFAVVFSGISLVATVPEGASSGPITVITANGAAATQTSFVITAIPPPEITGFSPRAGSVGSSVSITGRNLDEATDVLFNGVPADFSVLANSISAFVPGGAATGPITIRTPGGSSESSEAFTVMTAGTPVITSISPERGRPGERVTILGEHIETATAVQFNGAPAQFELFGFSIFATVPTQATSGVITVETPMGTARSGGAFTVISALFPEISRFEPQTGVAGTEVTIGGTNFIAVTEVSFAGRLAEFTHLSDSEIRAVVPIDAVSGPITVRTEAGVAASGDNFLLPARVLGFEPGHGPIGSEVIVQGENFLDVIAVLLANVSMPFTIVSAGEIRAVVPQGAVSGAISVATPAGFAISRSNFFLPPGGVSFSPGSGLPGTIVSVVGENLLGVSRVDFGGVPAEFNPISMNAMTALVPEGAVSGPITVTTPAGKASSLESFLSGLFSDLSVQVTATPDEVESGDFLSYTIGVTNHGPLEASGVVVTNWLPSGVSVVFLPAGVETTEADNVLTCRIGSISSGFGTSLRVLTIVTGATHLTNTVSVSSQISDPNLSNNSATLITAHKGAQPPPPPVEDVSITASIAGGELEVSWTGAAAGFSLEWAPSLVPPVTWSPAGNSPELVNGRNTIRLSAPSGSRFYRLRKP